METVGPVNDSAYEFFEMLGRKINAGSNAAL